MMRFDPEMRLKPSQMFRNACTREAYLHEYGGYKIMYF